MLFYCNIDDILISGMNTNYNNTYRVSATLNILDKYVG